MTEDTNEVGLPFPVYDCIYGATFSKYIENVVVVEPEVTGDQVLLTKEDLVKMLQLMEEGSPKLKGILPNNMQVCVVGLTCANGKHECINLDKEF
jgi:hypothetical protein